MPKYYVQLPTGTVLQTDDISYWPEAKRLSVAKGKQFLKDEARVRLLEELKPGDTVFCILRHCSRSGMRRHIDFCVIRDGDHRLLTGDIGHLLGYSRPPKGDGLIVDGCGMDMGFSVVYHLGSALWPKGDGKFISGRNGDKGPETSGGYLLKHSWL
jgi:hypothetical protein